MWYLLGFSIIVVILGFSGGALALFVRGMHAETNGAAAFCAVSAVAVAQVWIVISGIGKPRRLSRNVRRACYIGAQARFRPVFLLGFCSFVGVLPMALMGAHSEAQTRFATFMVGGVAISTAAALFILPVAIAWVAKRG